MTRCLALSWCFVVPLIAGAQTPTDSLRRLDAAWAHAYATHDTTTAIALFSRRLVVTSADGRLKDKATELADLRPTAGLVMQYFRTADVRVEMFKEMGIVIGLAEWAFTYNGRDSAVRRRYTAVYVRGGRLGWQMVALHIGRAPEPEPAR